MAVTQALDPKVALAAVRSMESKMDAVLARASSTPADALVIRTIPAVKGTGPNGEIEYAPSAPRDEAAASAPAREGLQPTVKVDAPPAERDLTDEEIYDKVGQFLDPTMMGPVFISEPIDGKIYVGKYPNFGEMLAAQKHVTMAPKDADDDTVQLYGIIGELQQSIKGWLPAHSPEVEGVRANLCDASKWPLLYEFSILNQRDPRFQTHLVELWSQFLTWKILATPTDVELEKYYGRATTGRSS